MWQIKSYERHLGLSLGEGKNVTYCEVSHLGQAMAQAK